MVQVRGSFENAETWDYIAMFLVGEFDRVARVHFLKGEPQHLPGWVRILLK